ncbi:hypothetical protein EDD11_007525 [Mortierella claussenii]|nr:hypothetical protein EDD11_007525 [Mortierella claussenii]
MLPTLWFVYDGFRMRNIPASILIKYSPLFRIISNTGPFKGPFRCKHLIELSTVYGQEWSRELLVLNPGLKRLVWGGPYHRRIETLEQQQEWELELKALMGLENLDVLRTSGFSLGEGLFVKVLQNNANRLSNLQVSTVEGVTSIAGLELPYLTELQIAFGGTDSPALVDLVRCCPRLQKLSLIGSRTRSPVATPLNPHASTHLNTIGSSNNNNINNNNDMTVGSNEFQIERLAQNIEQCCPALQSIKFSSSILSSSSSSSSTSNTLNTLPQSNQYFLHDVESALLVNACKRLESFSADMATLDHALTEALVGQRKSLQSLTLSFLNTMNVHYHPPPPHHNPQQQHEMMDQHMREDRIREIHCMRRLKASLPKLKELNLFWDKGLMTTGATAETTGMTHTHVLPQSLQEEVATFLEEPWSCLDLETLHISGIMPPPLSSSFNSTLASSPSTAITTEASTDTGLENRVSAKVGSGPSYDGLKSQTLVAIVTQNSSSSSSDGGWQPQMQSRQLSKSSSSSSLHSNYSGSSNTNLLPEASSSSNSSEAERMQSLVLALNLSPLTRLRNFSLNHAVYQKSSAH